MFIIKNKVLGDEGHAILKCPRFSDVRQSFLIRFEKFISNIKDLNDTDKLLYILTCECDSVRLVSHFLVVVLSA